jgi:hypothetical protein
MRQKKQNKKIAATTYVSEEMNCEVNLCCEREDISRSLLLRRFISDGLQKERKKQEKSQS